MELIESLEHQLEEKTVECDMLRSDASDLKKTTDVLRSDLESVWRSNQELREKKKVLEHANKTLHKEVAGAISNGDIVQTQSSLSWSLATPLPRQGPRRRLPLAQ
eukprot:2374973-Rhodomonas_salina.1